ncbi:MAG: hypothetical protein V7L21_15005 [Nostoc sp.]|uniref:hypothetical protein n=1 Tax=Nostoc sp. TaxID=1180 RepID=UPI002FF5B2A2
MRLWGSRATGSVDREWLQQKVVQGCFPLHPLATYCLPRLNAVLALGIGHWALDIGHGE